MADLAWSLALVVCVLGGRFAPPSPVWAWVMQHPLLKPLVSPLPLVVRVLSLNAARSHSEGLCGPLMRALLGAPHHTRRCFPRA